MEEKKEQSEVEGSMRLLRDAIGQLNSSISILVESLAPVLRGPQDTCGESVGEDDMSSCPLSIEITYMANLVLEKKYTITNLLSRLGI